jgi:CRISPR-associated protein (TIGR02584 family)
MRRVCVMEAASLLFVAGASPQIITETVYGLLQRGAVAPTRVRVMTTTAGRQRIRTELLGRGGHWVGLAREHPQARAFHLAARDVVVLQDSNGRPLDDVRSDADNVAAADQIASTVADLTRDGAPPLHASIAGGRKTMGYSLAAAMMLHGRREDRLSHVLVHPASLEGSDFFYPPARPTGLCRYRRADGRAVSVQASAIRVELAELPFPRLRILKDMTRARKLAFSELVRQIQFDLDLLASPGVTVRAADDVIACAGRPLHLTPVQVEIYALLAERRKGGCPLRECGGCPVCFLPAEEIAGMFRARLSQRMRARESAGVGAEWGGANFRPERQKINGKIREVLRDASEPYVIRAIGDKRNRLYGISVAPDAITIG